MRFAASLVAVTLLASPAIAEKPAADEEKAAGEKAAAEKGAAKTARTIVISGDDAELVESVAAELRAAGFDVVIVAPNPRATDDAAIVSVERIGDSVVVHAQRADGVLDAELLESSEGDGMSDGQATALRAAEAIRSLVTTPKKKRRKAKPPVEPAPETAAPPVTAEPETTPPVPETPPIPTATWPGRDGIEGEIHNLPVVRIGLFGGGGVVVPAPTFALGVSLRGQVTPHFNVAGMVIGTRNLGADGFEDEHHNIYGVRAALLASWEILGADHSWTPTLGGGLFAEARYWEGDGFGHDEPIPLGRYETSLYSPFYDGAMAGAGLVATAGFSIAHPFRFRFDVLADVRMITVELDGIGHDDMAPELAPSIIGTIGFEYDLITRPVRAKTARR